MLLRQPKSLVLVGTVLVTWACAKGLETDGGDTRDDTTGGTGAGSGHVPRGGSAGDLMQPGTGGATPGFGGTPATGTGGGTAATGATSGTGGSGGRSDSGGGSAMGGRAATGGASPAGGASAMAGRSASGGAETTGGVSAGGNATGGNATGGMPGGGVTSSGGATGMAGVPNDPNWKPPDMTATAKLIVLYQAQQTAPMSTDVRFNLTLKNMTDAAYAMSKVTIRYWMSSEPAPTMHVYYSSAGLKVAGTPKFVGNMSNSYVEISFSAGGTVPVYVDQNSLNDTQIQAAVNTSTQNAHFDQSNDWSFDGTAAQAKPNPKITMYDNGTLIWGCDPSHVCAAADTSSVGGAGGQPN